MSGVAQVITGEIRHSDTRHTLVMLFKDPRGNYRYMDQEPLTDDAMTLRHGDHFFRIRLGYPISISADEARTIDTMLTDIYGYRWAKEDRAIADGIRKDTPIQEIKQLMFNLDPERYPLF